MQIPKFIFTVIILLISSAVFSQKSNITKKLSVKVFASEQETVAEKELAVYWNDQVPLHSAQNDKAKAKIKAALAEAGVDCPLDWTDLGDNIVKCGNGKIVVMTGIAVEANTASVTPAKAAPAKPAAKPAAKADAKPATK